MHILLLLLKTAGIILLILLALILILLAILLLVPIRYRFAARKDEDPAYFAGASFGWLFSLIRGNISFDPDGLSYEGRAACFVLIEKKAEKKEESVGEEPPEEKKEEADREEAAKAESVREEPSEEKREESVKEDSVGAESSEEKKAEPVKTKSLEENKTEAVKTEGSEEENDQKNIFHMIDGIIEKISGLKEKAQKKAGELDRIRQRIDKHPLDVYLACAADTAKRLVLHIRPRRLEGSLDYGWEDYYRTGQVTACLASVYPLYAKQLDIRPHFGEEILQGEIEGSGRVRIGYLLYLLGRLLTKKEIRRLIRLALKGEL